MVLSIFKKISFDSFSRHLIKSFIIFISLQIRTQLNYFKVSKFVNKIMMWQIMKSKQVKIPVSKFWPKNQGAWPKMTLYHKDIVLHFHLQKKPGSIGLETTELWLLLNGQPEFLENQAFDQIGLLFEIFKLVPRAQFPAKNPKSFFCRPH